jgi:hypothetical protein
VWTAAATLTSDSTLTAAAQLSAHAAAALTADSALDGTLKLSAHAAAALAATTDLTADANSSQIPEVAKLSAGNWDLRIEQGSTFVQTFTVRDDDFTWDGWTARSQIRTAPADNGDLILDLGPYLTVMGPAVRIAIPASVTQTVDRNGVWDLEMANGPAVVRILQGRAIVSLEVTR